MRTVLLLLASNIFMTTAWYWHLKTKALPLVAIIAISWAIALPEYCLAVPANRIGNREFGGAFSPPQLKILQEGISVVVFIGFTMFVLGQPPRWRDIGAMACILAGLALSLSGKP